MDNKRRKTSVEMDEEQLNTSCCFNDMPDEICGFIFRYLSLEERCKVGRVCKKWYRISRDPDPVFWRQVELDFSTCPQQSIHQLTMKMLDEVLPPCVLRLKVNHDIMQITRSTPDMDFAFFATKLSEKFPKLEVLVLLDVVLKTTDCTHVILKLINLLPESLRILSLQGIMSIRCSHFVLQDAVVSNIEILDLSFSDINIEPSIFLKMPHLRKLRLAGYKLGSDFFDSLHSVVSQLNVLDLEQSCIASDAFRVVQIHGINLTELYVCSGGLTDSDFILDSQTAILPRLQVLCLRQCFITYGCLDELIDTCPSLFRVYVSNNMSLKSMYDYSFCYEETLNKMITSDEDENCYHFEHENYLYDS